MTDGGGLDRALAGVVGALGRVRFELSGGERPAREGLRDRVVRDIEGHRARLRDIEAPLLVVLGGVTGAGKSTVVNTLLGRPAVATGVLRPTTYDPTLITTRADAGWFTGDRVLAGLARVEPRGGRAPRSRAGALVFLRDDALPPGLALVDAPDVDSIGKGNRDLADRLLDAADLWLWFTSVGKYADEDSMRYLRRAAARRTALAVVLTQVRPGDTDEVVADFRDKLAAEGLAQAPLLVIPWTVVEDEQLPAAAIAGLRDWLRDLSSPELRVAQRRRTLEGALDALPADLAPMVAALEDEARTAELLREEADRAYAHAERDFAAALEQGLPLRQEVLARWDRYVGGSRFLRLAEQATGQARAWIRGLSAGPVDPRERKLERDTRVEVAGTLGSLMTQLVDLAAAQTAAEWARMPAGRDLLARHPGLQTSAADLDRRAERAVAEWQDDVVGLVESAGADRRTNARLASTAVTSVATVALLVVLGSTAGLTGAEVGIAAAAGAAHQTILVKLLGAGNLRWLIEQARDRISARFAHLADAERDRFHDAIADGDPEGDAEGIRAALAAVTAARHTPLPAGEVDRRSLGRGARALAPGAAPFLRTPTRRPSVDQPREHGAGSTAEAAPQALPPERAAGDRGAAPGQERDEGREGSEPDHVPVRPLDGERTADDQRSTVERGRA